MKRPARHLSTPSIRGALPWLFLFLAAAAPPSPAAADSPPNVLFIMADDLRPWLGCYGEAEIKTPAIDRLASRGMVFNRAYCQDAVCGPSRASLLTGLRPDSTRIFDNDTHFRTHNPDIVTLPQWFRKQGYQTQAIGKIFHSHLRQAYVGDRLDDPPSWSEPSWFPPAQYYLTEPGESLAREIFLRRPDCGLYQGQMCIHNRLQEPVQLSAEDMSRFDGDEWQRHFVQGAICEAPDVPDNDLGDGEIADRAIRALRQSKDTPFFLAVGFLRPHTPYVAPKRYWDLYERESFEPVANASLPAGIEHMPYPPMHDHAAYTGVAPQGALDPEAARELMHGYAACVSYIDAQTGRILDELDQLGLQQTTIVVFLGDHGYHLGENGRWGKQTCYETATRAPLIVASPDASAPGESTNGLVEFVDIFPSLCEIAGLPVPEGLEGASFAPLLDDPSTPWKKGAFSQFPQPVRLSRPEIPSESDDLMGRTVRTDRYRYVEWQFVQDPERIEARELYDYKADPGETQNLAQDPDYQEVLNEMTALLRNGWRGITLER